MALAVDGRDGGGLVGDDRAQVRKLLGQALPAITVARLDLEKNLTENSELQRTTKTMFNKAKA